MGASSCVGHDVREQVPDGVECAQTQVNQETGGNDARSPQKGSGRAGAAGRLVRILNR